MRVSRISAILMATSIVATAACGQPKAAAPAKPLPPWKQFPLNPHTRVKLDFRNASVDAVIHMLSQASGITIIKDPALAGGITLQSPKTQTLGDAFAMLNAVLGLKNYEIDKEGNFLLIKAGTPAATQTTAQAGPGQPTPGQPTPGQPMPPGQNQPMPGPMTGGKGITGKGASGKTGKGGGKAGAPGAPGTPGAPGSPATPASTEPVLKVYPLKYADATEVARVVNEVFAGNNPQPPNPFQPQPPPNPTAPKGPTVKASAEDFSNSIIVNAPPAQQEEITQIVAQIDKSQDLPQQPRVFVLQYARATELQSVIQDILSGTSPLGRGGPTTSGQSRNNNSFPYYIFGGTPPSNNEGGTVVADSRTNSLIVTSTPENLDHVAEVLKQLDKPASYQSTTFVYVLKNARADVVANLLNQSFGNRTTNGPVGGSLTNTGLTQASANRAATTSAVGNTQPPTLNGGNNGNNNTQDQNFGNSAAFQNSGLFGSQNQNGQTTGLDSEGRVVNVRSLTNQVLIVPNIDTNSLIIAAPPEDRQIIEDILKEMDEVPEQVMIETLVVEANLDKSEQLGVEYNLNHNDPFGIHGLGSLGQSFGLQGNTAQPQGFRFTLTAGQYQIFLQAVQTEKRFNVLSTPRIFTTNNATAQINISQSLPYVTNQTVETTGTTLYNYNFLDVGIVLTVTPRVTSNGHVIMDVTQTANDFVGYTPFNAPIVNQREAQTTVNVADGETVVLGGIINNTVTSTRNKVPFLGDIPLIGNLFRSVSKDNAKTELLVFMTPHVVHDPEEARRLRQQTEVSMGKTAQKMLSDDQKAEAGAGPR